MNKSTWFTFEDTVTFIRSAEKAPGNMMPIYHRRESYIEKLLESVILVPCRSLASELQDSSVRFSSPHYRRRLFKYTQYHFLCQPIRTFAQLTRHDTVDHSRYLDSARRVAAERRQPSEIDVSESEATLRADILSEYCDHYRLVAFWVTDSIRYSERALREFGLRNGTKHFQGRTFRYFQNFATAGRPPMCSRSQICGKRVLFPSYQ